MAAICTCRPGLVKMMDGFVDKFFMAAENASSYLPSTTQCKYVNVASLTQRMCIHTYLRVLKLNSHLAWYCKLSDTY